MNNDPDSILAKILGEKASDMVARIERETFEESSEFDKVSTAPDHVRMNVPTREEIDAKLETIETRMDGRIARIDDKMAQILESNMESKAAVASLKITVIVTAVTAVIAIVGGVAAFNATVLSNMVASFESGKSTASSLTEAAGRLDSTNQRLERIEQLLNRSAEAGRAAQTP